MSLDYTTEVLALSPTWLWQLDEASGTTVATDESTNGNDGTYNTSTSFTREQTGVVDDGGNSIQPATDADRIQINSSPSTLGPWTFTCWLNGSGATGPDFNGNQLFGYNNGAFNDAFEIDFSASDRLRFRVEDAGTDTHTSNAHTFAGNTTFIAVTRSSSGVVKIFLDGAQSGGQLNSTKEVQAGPNTTTLGRASGGGDGLPVNTDIDAVAFWDSTELTAAQIEDLYFAGLGSMSGTLQGTSTLPAATLDKESFNGTVQGQSSFTARLNKYRLVNSKWQRKSQEQTVTPAFIVTITVGGTDHKFESATGSTSLFGNPVSVADVGPVARNVDALLRKPQVESIEVLFVDDGAIRDLVTNNELFNKTVEVKFGFEGLDETDFGPYFKGIIEEIRPSEGMISMTVVGVNKLMMDREITAHFVNRHPVQALNDIIEAAGIPAASRDLSSLDPDSYNASDRGPASHFNMIRTDANIATGVGETDKVQAMKLADEILRIFPGILWANEGGQIEFKIYDPDRSPRATWTADDIDEFTQKESFSNLFNEAHLYFLGSAKTAPSSAVTPGSDDPTDNVNYRSVWVHLDADAQTSQAVEGATKSVRTLHNKTKWWNGQFRFQTLAAGAIGLPNTHGPGDTFILIGSDISALTGARGFDDSSALHSDLDDAEGRTAILRITGADDSTPAFKLEKGEFIEIDQVTQAFVSASDQDLYYHPDQDLEPADEGDPDGGYLIEPLKVDIPGGTTGGGGTYVPLPTPGTGYGPTIMALECRIKARELFGTSKPGGTGWIARNSGAVDYTMAIDYTKKMLGRFKNGIAIVDVTTNLSQYDLQLGDFVRLENDVFLKFGLDGISPSDRVWEITSKEINPYGDTPHIKWTLAEVRPENSVTLPAGTSPGGGAFINLPDWWRDYFGDGSGFLGTDPYFGSGNEFLGGDNLGYDVTNPSGFDVAVSGGAIMGGPHGLGMKTRGGVKFTLDANSTYGLYADSKRGGIVTRRATGSDPPAEEYGEKQIAVVVTDGLGVSSIEDRRHLGKFGMSAVHLALNEVNPRHINPDTELFNNQVRNGDFAIIQENFTSGKNLMDAWFEVKAGVVTTNLVVNDSATTSEYSTTTSDTLTGGRALVFTGPTGFVSREVKSSEFIAVTEGEVYEIATLFKSPDPGGGGAPTLQWEFFDSSKASVSSATQSLVLSSTFIHRNTFVTIPSTAKFLQVGMIFNDITGQTTTVDRISVVKSRCLAQAGPTTPAPTVNRWELAGTYPLTRIIDWTTPAINRGSCFDDSTERFTAKRAGTYEAKACLLWEATGVTEAQQFRTIIRRLNSSLVLQEQRSEMTHSATATVPVQVSVSATFNMAAGDIIDVQGRLEAAGSADINLSTDTSFTYLSVEGPF